MRPDEILERVARCLQRLEEDDADLLQVDANERSLTHRLAVYMEDEFRGWNVDCEYNRKDLDPKTLMFPPPGDVPADDDEARTVYPDIIVHRRRTTENLLVIEARKLHAKHIGIDPAMKLRAYVAQLGYQNAYFVSLRTGDGPSAALEVFFPQDVKSR